MSFETPPATRTVETTVRLNATPGRTINTFLHDNDLKAWYEPGRPLFGPLQLEIVAAPADNGCELTVLHHGYQHGDDWDWLHDAVVRGWSAVLGELQEWLASG